ncbi:hypothetical protein [Pseudoxanthomonas mexicana]
MILPPRSRQKQAQSDGIAADVAAFLKKRGNRIEVLGPTPLRDGHAAREANRNKLIFEKAEAARAQERRRRGSDEEE